MMCSEICSPHLTHPLLRSGGQPLHSTRGPAPLFRALGQKHCEPVIHVFYCGGTRAEMGRTCKYYIRKGPPHPGIKPRTIQQQSQPIHYHAVVLTLSRYRTPLMAGPGNMSVGLRFFYLTYAHTFIDT